MAASRNGERAKGILMGLGAGRYIRSHFSQFRKSHESSQKEDPMTYKQSIIDAMAWLGEQSDTIFIGQTVVAGGSFFASSLEKVPLERRLEFPVAEEMQLGASLGVALQG